MKWIACFHMEQTALTKCSNVMSFNLEPQTEDEKKGMAPSLNKLNLSTEKSKLENKLN